MYMPSRFFLKVRQAYIVGATVLHIPGFISVVLLFMENDVSPLLRLAALLAYGFLIVIPIVWCYYSLLIFRLPYSAIGQRECTSFPFNEPFIKCDGRLGVRFKKLPACYRVGRCGIGFKIPYLGEGFIPAEMIDEIILDSGGNGVIHHRSAEIRSPLRFPGSVIAALESVDFVVGEY
jgi:hypothetical protein